ncbi:arsenate reductase/protein-tyrosine-phosphatase family protein [Terrabacter sp. 2RAF25]|uniref:arsenate reductase/protein-tyrosine-phosphatase family protein n=1 Tax=Terrabacter sp. 2RAF25 TaxID=3232998 RepID=UPI003F9D275D
MLGDASRNRGILFVCTGNICRSPYAERRLRQLLPAAGVEIVSAGTGALVGSDFETETRDSLRQQGADVTGFAARSVTREILGSAELVLTMTRTHRGQVSRLNPAVMRRAFALGDFADLCSASGTWRPINPAQPWLPQVAAEAAAARGTVAPRDLDLIDVVDPYGRSARTHAEAFDRIEDCLGTIVQALGAVAGSARASHSR